MTQRKPPRLSFPDWVDLQVRTAEDAGAFANLPGKGKPIKGLDDPHHEMTWIVEKLRRENVDVAGVLPPALALAKEVEVLPETLAGQWSEARVRAHVIDLNERIRHARAMPQVGPPVRVRTVDVDAALEHWRASRAELESARAAAVTPVTPVTVVAGPVPRRRFWRWWPGRR